MARIITNNPIFRGMSGRFGNLVIRQTKNGPVVSVAPDYSNYKPHPGQQRQIEKFRRAAAYASAINNDPVQREEWVSKLKKGQSVYQAAMKEYLQRPEE